MSTEENLLRVSCKNNFGISQSGIMFQKHWLGIQCVDRTCFDEIANEASIRRMRQILDRKEPQS